MATAKATAAVAELDLQWKLGDHYRSALQLLIKHLAMWSGHVRTRCHSSEDAIDKRLISVSSGTFLILCGELNFLSLCLRMSKKKIAF